MWRQLRRKCAPVLFMSLLAIAAVGCTGNSRGIDGTSGTAAGQPRSTAAATQVVIDNFTFDPPTLTIPVGTRVTWVNRDDVPHTATSTAKPKHFDSGTLDTDGQFSHVFTGPGTYEYFCAVHPTMTGQIIVK